ncbi:hypothetical protein LEP3755_13610 [Leptolyngbya sp. NIES-3755]|nr:hypothetical protein LEP3755_13610 [Leptolyngbya sp. NIES-3755]
MVGKERNFFVSIIERSDYISSTWNPNSYQSCAANKLQDFMDFGRISSKERTRTISPFRAIEYRDIPDGNYLSFKLERDEVQRQANRGAWVTENTLLFGTMRAYLGNVIVTPQAPWIGYESSDLCFQVKSEFVTLLPYDELNYFWLIYLRSKQFLEKLPLGSGGTRPRLQPELLHQVPVDVPSIEIRKKIHDQVSTVAKTEWENCLKLEAVHDYLLQV